MGDCFALSGLRSLRKESSAEINVHGSTSAAAHGAYAEVLSHRSPVAPSMGGVCEYAGAAPALVLPAVCQFCHLQKNSIYLSTAFSSSLTATIAKKRFDFSFLFPLCRTAGIYTWTSDRFKVCCLSWEGRIGGIALFQVRTGSLSSPSVHLLLPFLLPFPSLCFVSYSGTDRSSVGVTVL